MDVRFRVLEHAYGYDNGAQTEQETNSGNKIIHGDNLACIIHKKRKNPCVTRDNCLSYN